MVDETSENHQSFQDSSSEHHEYLDVGTFQSGPQRWTNHLTQNHNINLTLAQKEKLEDHQSKEDVSSGDHEYLCKILWKLIQEMLRYFKNKVEFIK